MKVRDVIINLRWSFSLHLKKSSTLDVFQGSEYVSEALLEALITNFEALSSQNFGCDDLSNTETGDKGVHGRIIHIQHLHNVYPMLTVYYCLYCLYLLKKSSFSKVACNFTKGRVSIAGVFP